VERKRRVALALAAVLVVVLAGVALAVYFATRPEEEPVGPGDVRPAGALDSGGILLGRDLVPGGDAPSAEEAVTVEVVSDFLCPWCGLLEKAQGEAFAELAAAGEIRLIIHPVNTQSGINDEYSWRAMTAVETVAALEPDRFWAFHETLWANQPTESKDSPDLTDEAIADLAAEAGVSQETIDQFADPGVAEWAKWSSDQGRDRIEGTPTVFLSYAGSEPVQWKNWLLVGEDSEGQEVYQRTDMAAAVAKVKAGEDPNSE
jgi:protein-disulfide isomerase